MRLVGSRISIGCLAGTTQTKHFGAFKITVTLGLLGGQKHSWIDYYYDYRPPRLLSVSISHAEYLDGVYFLLEARFKIALAPSCSVRLSFDRLVWSSWSSWSSLLAPAVLRISCLHTSSPVPPSYSCSSPPSTPPPKVSARYILKATKPDNSLGQGLEYHPLIQHVNSCRNGRTRCRASHD